MATKFQAITTSWAQYTDGTKEVLITLDKGDSFYYAFSDITPTA